MRLLIATLGVLACLASPLPADVSDAYLATWLKQRIAKLTSQFAHRPFEQIGWVDDLETALILGGEHNRPVFLFTHDGDISTGRC